MANLAEMNPSILQSMANQLPQAPHRGLDQQELTRALIRQQQQQQGSKVCTFVRSCMPFCIFLPFCPALHAAIMGFVVFKCLKSSAHLPHHQSIDMASSLSFQQSALLGLRLLCTDILILQDGS